MTTWINDIVTAMSNLGGSAHYDALYDELKRIRLSPLPSAWKKIVQRKIQDHAIASSGFKKRKQLFRSVNGLGSGSWALLSEEDAQPLNISVQVESSTAISSGSPSALSKRNAAWSRDELILALFLYMNYRKAPLNKGSAEVLELSTLLNAMGAALVPSISNTFRNPNGVYMKLMNFRRFDPDYTGSGKVGLSRGNKDEEAVWKEFSADLDRLNQVANAIRITVKNAPLGQLEGVDEPGITEASEGRVLTRLHRYRERNRAIVEERKKLALKMHGRLACEVCSFDFSAVYGNAGSGLIDVHHVKPVHTLADGEKTKLKDLALLCANCHRVVHSSRNWLSIEEVRSAFLQQANAAVKV